MGRHELRSAHTAKPWLKTWTMVLFVALTVWQANAAEKLNWLTDLPKAQAQAKQEGKMVLMDFTGSDWCSWCMKLDKEIFQTPEFADYAKEHLVLVEVDFPKKKPQSQELQKANEALEKRYKIEQYPTVIVLNKRERKSGNWVTWRGDPRRLSRNWKN